MPVVVGTYLVKLKHGWGYLVDANETSSLVTDEDLEQIKRVGGLAKFSNLWLDGKVKTHEQIMELEEDSER